MAEQTRRERRKKPSAEKKDTSLFARFLTKRAAKDRDKPAKKAEKKDTVAGNGQVLQTRGAQLGKVLAWAVAVFVILAAVITFANFLNPPKPVAQTVEEKDTSQEQQAGDYARGYVSAWLRATEDDHAELEQYKSVGRGEVTETKPTEFTDPGVASVKTDEEGMSTVIVSAKVKAEAAVAEDGGKASDDEEETSETWVPAWYQVNVYQNEGTFAPVGWPAPVSPPETAEAPNAEYQYQASPEVEATVDDFFRAYILNDGDVTRLTHPESTIRSLGATPYSVVMINKTTLEEEHKEIPDEGTTVHALVNLSLGTGDKTTRTATYALTLETRGGRWEVKAIDPAPEVAPDAAESTEETAGPTGPTESATPEESASPNS
jgi:hypothetical protein